MLIRIFLWCKVATYSIGVLLLVMGGLHGQHSDFKVSHYGVAEGLSNEWVSDIIQDSTGFLWIATQYGINRFDGQDFTTYTYRPGQHAGPSSNWVKTLLAVNGDTLFLGTLAKGLSLMNSQAETFITAQDAMDWPNMGVVDDLHQDVAGNYWLASRSGAYFNEAGKKSLLSLVEIRNRAIAEWEETGIFLAGEAGIHFIEKGKYKSEPKLIYDEKTHAVLPISADSLLFVTNDAVQLLTRKHSGTWSRSNWELLLPEVDYYFYLPKFLQTPDGQIWLTIGSWMYVISPEMSDYQIFRPGEVLGEDYKDCLVHCLFLDREGNHWWGTDCGLFQLTPPRQFS